MTDPMTDPVDETVDTEEPTDDEFDVDDVPAPDDGSTRPRSDGVSTIAIPAPKTWDAGDRPVGWQGRVYGLVVHTTGGSLPRKARELGVYHAVHAVNWYTSPKSHGCHYVNGWRGAQGGDLLQVANEREQASGVGVTNAKEPHKDQRRSIEAGRFEADLPDVLVRHWRARWPDATHSLDLLPGTRTANACYVHVECVPCVFGGLTGEDVEPMRPGLRFTEAQHDTVAALAVDVARRNGWPSDEQWWRTPRLLGHEDLTPISRHDRNGGWDPGYLRDEPHFDWDHVYERIEAIWSDEPAAADGPGSGEGPSILDTLGELGQQFLDLMSTGQERAAVVDAHAQGVTDPDKLTNLVFFARHPEMDGRRIEPHETDLAEEWIDIRDSIVRPALDGLTDSGDI